MAHSTRYRNNPYNMGSSRIIVTVTDESSYNTFELSPVKSSPKKPVSSLAAAFAIPVRNSNSHQKASPVRHHSRQTAVNGINAIGCVGNDDDDDEDDSNYQQQYHQCDHQQLRDEYDYNQNQVENGQQQPAGARATAAPPQLPNEQQQQQQQQQQQNPAMGQMPERTNQGGPTVQQQPHRHLPTRHLVSAAWIQQYLPSSDGINIRTIAECFALVQSFNNRGVITKADLGNFAATRMNHQNNGNDNGDEEIHQAVDALIIELHRNMSTRHRFRVPVLIQFNIESDNFMSSNEIDAFLRNYDFSADNLHPLAPLGLQYVPYPTQRVYDSEAVCSRPLHPAVHLPESHKVMIGLGPHTPQREQIAFIVALMCDVQLLGLPTVGNIKVKPNGNRAPTIKTPFVYLEVATLAEANRIIATFHDRVILDEGGWWFARTDEEIATLRRYTYGMLSQQQQVRNGKQQAIRFQHRPYLPLTASLFHENPHDRNNALAFDAICAITNPNRGCAAFRRQHQNTNFARVDHYCHYIQHTMFDDPYFDGRMLPTHANLRESDAWYKVHGLDASHAQDNDGTVNLKYPSVSQQSANICYNNAAYFWRFWSNSPVVPFSPDRCLCNNHNNQY